MNELDEQKAPLLIHRLRRYFPEVNRVADSTKHLLFEVTEDDCAIAKKKVANRCAAAQAIARQKKVDGVLIRPNVAYVVKGDLAVKYNVPQTVKSEVVSFDRHGDFREGVYHLAPVSPSNRIGRKGKNTGPKTHRAKNHPAYHRTEGIRNVGSDPKDGSR